MSSRPRAAWPGPVYLDSSALAKLYLPEPGSDELELSLRGRRDVFVSDLAVTEVVSALGRRVREGGLRIGDARAVRDAMRGDLEAGGFLRAELLPQDHREAERILLSVGEVPLRAADALHLALARSSGSVSVVTYDVRMAAGAARLGLVSLPPARG